MTRGPRGAALLLAALGLGIAPARADTTASDPALQRHSPLRALTPANVGRLEPAWTLPTGADRGHEGAPLVVGDTLYLVTPWPNRVTAVDLATRRPRWQWASAPADPQAPSRMCCGPVNRGLAYAPPRPALGLTTGTVLLATGDARLVALDATTGRERWQQRLGRSEEGITSSGAPQVLDDVVIAGIAGGEYGVRGHLDGYDLATGRRLWRGYSTGPDAEIGLDPRRSTTWRHGAVQPVGPDSSLASWAGTAWQHGGGTTWGAFSADAERRLVYYGSGNPGSWNPLARPGDNRWTNALWARDRDTGRVRWVLQLTPHDEWDYDGVNESVLYDGPAPAREPRLAHFDRNGYVYVLERDTGALRRVDRYDPAANWARGIDLANARPDVDPARSTQAAGEDETVTGICPAAIGAKNQAPVAYDPARRLFFVPTLRLCMDMEAFAADYRAGQPWIGASYTLRRAPQIGADGRPTGREAAAGALVAWDADAGRARWTADEPLPLWGGVLSTAGGLVFYGTLDGHLKARDARDGRLLWSSPALSSGIVGSVTSWSWHGRQYVGVYTGIGGLAADPDGIGKLVTEARPLPPAPGAFVAFSLPTRP